MTKKKLIKFNKKGAMQLSINMIVILIIAVVILGLALGFIQGMFGKIQKDFIGRAKEEPAAPAASATETLTMSKGDTIIASPGEEVTAKWSVFCTNSSGYGDVNLSGVGCGGTDLTVQSNFLDKLGYGSSGQLITFVEIPSSMALGKHMCVAEASANVSGTMKTIAKKDIILEVMK